MLDLNDKRNIISRQESKIAQQIAHQVMDKPKLSVWMILIPIVFLYYFYGIQRYTAGKKDFVKNFIQTRAVILDAACSFLESGEKVDFQTLAMRDNVPRGSVEAYKNWAKLLFDHYLKLLKSNGDSFAAMVKAGYREQGRYLLIQDQLSKTEVQFYKALRNSLKNSAEGAEEVIRKIENCLGHLRRDEARLVFTA